MFICDVCGRFCDPDNRAIFDEGATEVCLSCAPVYAESEDADNAIFYLEDVKEWREHFLEHAGKDGYDEDQILEVKREIGNLENAIRLLKMHIIKEDCHGDYGTV